MPTDTFSTMSGEVTNIRSTILFLRVGLKTCKLLIDDVVFLQVFLKRFQVD